MTTPQHFSVAGSLLRTSLPLFICLLAMLVPLQSQADNEEARDSWMEGYAKLEDARKAEDEGRRELAVSLYSSALTLFQDVKTRYPDWNPSLLRYRIKFCRERMEALRTRIESGEKALNKNDLLEKLSTVQENLRELQASLQQKNREIDLTASALERARREAARNAAAREQTESLLQEKQALALKLDRSRERVVKLEKDLDQARRDTREQRRADMLADRLKVVETEKERVEQQLTEKQQSLSKAENQLTAMGTDRERLRAELQEQRQVNEALREATGNVETKVERLSRQLEEQKEAQAVTIQQKTALERRVETARREKRDAEAKVVGLENQIREIEQAREEAERKAAAAARQTEALRQLSRQKAETEKKMADLEATLREFERAKEEAENKAAVVPRQAEALAKLGRQKAEMEATVAQLQTKIRDIEKDRAETDRQTTVLPEQIEALNKLIQEKDDQLNVLTKRLQATRADLDTREQQFVRTKAIADARINETQQLRLKVAALDKALVESENTINELKAKLARASTGKNTLINQVDTYRNEVTELEKASERATRQAASRLNLLRQQEKEIKDLGQKIDELSSENRKLRQARAAAPPETPDLVKLKKDLHNALTESEYHRQKAAATEKELQQQTARMKLLEQDLEKKTRGESETVASLREKFNQVREQLAHEQQRASDLELTLAEFKTRLPTLPSQGAHAPTPSDDSERVTALLHKAVAAEKEGNLEAAIWNYKNILEHDPRQAIALRRLGHLSLQQGNTQEAIAYLNRAFYTNPDEVETLTELGFALIREEKADLAVSMLARAAALDNTSPAVHTQLGVACSSLGWKEAAEMQFRRALKRDDTYAEAAFNLALLLGAEKDGQRMPEARKLYATARRNGAGADPALDQFFNFQDKPEP